MKKVMSILLLSCMAATSFSQETTPGLTREDYLAKAKGQHTGAVALAISGGTLVLVGGMIWLDGFGKGFDFDDDEDGFSALQTGDAMMAIGVIAMAGSIPLFSAANKNKKKALSISAGLQPVPQLHKTGPVYSKIPSMQLKIDL